MADLSAFPITLRWPATRPDVLQLYSWPTPNGVKVSIALEETGLAYEAHAVDIMKNQSATPEFLSLNPNGKIPAILDPNGPGGKPLALWESGAILVYLADRTGQLVPADPARRYETLQWVFFQMASIGPMFGQVGFFHKFAGREFEDKRPRDRYVAETKRLLGVLDCRLDGRTWIMGDDYTIADIAIWPWYGGLVLNHVYQAAEFLEAHTYTHVLRWAREIALRPAVQRGRKVNCTWGEARDQLHERHDASDFEHRTQDKLAAGQDG